MYFYLDGTYDLFLINKSIFFLVTLLALHFMNCEERYRFFLYPIFFKPILLNKI